MEQWLIDMIELRGPLPTEPQYQVVTDNPFDDREGPIQATAVV